MPAAATTYRNPYGAFELRRYPARREEPLQAWCAADTLLLEASHTLEHEAQRTLVVNDEHGALCLALQPGALWTDSALASLALQRNEETGGSGTTEVVWSTQMPAFLPALVVLRVPKQLPYLEYQLSRLARCMPAGATLLAAGMDKHLSPRTASLLERHIGPTVRHRGRSKARLFSATRDTRPAQSDNAAAVYHCDALEGELRALPNVFSRDKLDMGSRFLLQHIEELSPGGTVLDLACGNGVLGLVAFRRQLADHVVFFDESSMAVASSWLNASQLFPEQTEHFSFHHGDGLLEYPGQPADLILCNPPFHLNHTVDEFAGRHLLRQCGHHLGAGGRLCLVANRHLDYQPTLRREFKRVEKVAQNSKFNIWLAHKG
jgi:23S rRNA (guanine1835-N2)-methyltransferase